MKKAVFHSIMALVLVMGLTLAMATPVAAEEPPPSVGVEKDTIPGTGHPLDVYLVYQEVVYSLLVANDTGDPMTVNWIRDRFAPGSDAVEDAYWHRDDLEWVDENPDLPFGIDADDDWAESVTHTIRPEHLIDDPDFPGTKVVRNQIMFDAIVQGEHYEDFFPKTIRVIQPSIELEKSVSPSVAQVGETVTYTFTITNTGDWGLDNITLHDDVLGILTGHLPSLALPVGGSMSFEYAHPMGDQPVENTATVEAVAEGFSPTEFPYSDPEAELPTAVVRDTASARVEAEIPPVGGTAHPVSRLALLAPWIVLAGLVAGAAVFVWSRRAQSRA